MWTVWIKRKQLRKLEELPLEIQLKFLALKTDLQRSGPVQVSWRNYSKLSDTRHHCHLSYHFVACWQVLSDHELTMEVYYVGSRENAPY